MKRSFSLSDLRSPALVLACLLLIATAYGLVRFAYGLYLPDVRRSLDLGSGTAGLVFAGSSAMYCVGAAIGFAWARRAPRLLVAAAGCAAAVGAGGMAAAATSEVFAVFAIVGSAGAGIASPAVVEVTRRNVSPAANDRAQAVANSGTGPGLVVAGVLALAMLPDWRLAWTVTAGIAVVLVVVVVALDRGAVTSEAPVRPTSSGASWRRAHLTPATAALLMGAGSSVVWTYGRTHLQDVGFSETSSVLAWVVLGVGGSATALTVGPRAAGPWRTWTVAAGVQAVAIVLLASVSTSTTLAWTACFLFGWGYTAATSALIAWTGRIDPARSAAGTSGLFIVMMAGQAAGSAVAGAAVTHVGLGSTLVAAGIVVLLGAALGLRHPSTSSPDSVKPRSERPRREPARPTAPAPSAPRSSQDGSRWPPGSSARGSGGAGPLGRRLLQVLDPDRTVLGPSLDSHHRPGLPGRPEDLDPS